LDRELVKSNIKVVGKYVRCHLFERTAFLFDKKLLDMGSKLHMDYLENCQPLIANGKLVPLNDEEVMPYMNILWMLMVKDGCYNTWLSSKRANAYQVVQNSFIS
jgi:hypothetical protein